MNCVALFSLQRNNHILRLFHMMCEVCLNKNFRIEINLLIPKTVICLRLSAWVTEVELSTVAFTAQAYEALFKSKELNPTLA